jgi:hypothetical protein
VALGDRRVSDLRDTLWRLDAVIRPFAGLKPPLEGRRSAFSASLSSTARTLVTELNALDADRVVLELDYRAQDLRLDGYPRSGAKPLSPAVGIAFESRFGPLRYATGTFNRWTDNLRAIALGMEALRAVDRYGISRRGEQYVGYRQIAQTSGGFPSREAAQRWLEEHGGYREAARRLHPDNLETGDEEEFKKLQQARELVGATS